MRKMKITKIASGGISKQKSYYFALQSSWSLTKHLRGFKATEELAELCSVDENSYALEVSCEVGITACYIAKEYGW